MKRIYLLLIPAACLLVGSCTTYETHGPIHRYGSGYNTRYGYTDPWEVGYVSPYYRPYRPYQRSFFSFGSFYGHHRHYDTHDNHRQSQADNSKSKSPDGGSTLRQSRTGGSSSPRRESHPSGGSTLRQSRTGGSSSPRRESPPSGGSTLKQSRTGGGNQSSTKSGQRGQGKNPRIKR
ncbi:MAG: hypothetical protein VCA55_11645 [Verrucomicrobiales bacterium]